MPYFQCVHSRTGYPILFIPTCEEIMHEMPQSGNVSNIGENNTSCSHRNTTFLLNECFSQIQQQKTCNKRRKTVIVARPHKKMPKLQMDFTQTFVARSYRFHLLTFKIRSDCKKS